jgi:hypothetical protein
MYTKTSDDILDFFSEIRVSIMLFCVIDPHRTVAGYQSVGGTISLTLKKNGAVSFAKLGTKLLDVITQTATI